MSVACDVMRGDTRHALIEIYPSPASNADSNAA